MTDLTNKKTYQLALGGICLALTIIFMFGASIVPGAELTLYAISSLFIAVMILESGVKGGIALYIAAALLGLLIVPNKVGVLPYIGMFGLYGIVKFYIEKLKNPVAQVMLKVVFFCGSDNRRVYRFEKPFVRRLQPAGLPNMGVNWGRDYYAASLRSDLHIVDPYLL